MPKFKRGTKTPLIIEAEQYVEYGKLVKGMCNSRSCLTSGNNKPHVHTIHNNQLVNLEVGDFIIPEPDGVHFYPCKPDIFLNSYDPLGAPRQEQEKEYGEWIKASDMLPISPEDQDNHFRVDGKKVNGYFRKHDNGAVTFCITNETGYFAFIIQTEMFHTIEWLKENKGVLLTKERYDALMLVVEATNAIAMKADSYGPFTILTDLVSEIVERSKSALKHLDQTK